MCNDVDGIKIHELAEFPDRAEFSDGEQSRYAGNELPRFNSKNQSFKFVTNSIFIRRLRNRGFVGPRDFRGKKRGATLL